MTGELRQFKNEDMKILPENYNCSVYSMAAVAGCLLLCVGIVIYALLCA